jgi:dTDP-4-dehydrorhamnose reductase
MKTVIITGANGFVGYYLTEQLLNKGYKVIATGKGEKRLPFDHENFVYASMDFTNKQSVEKTFEEYQPHIVIHNGAMSKPDDCELNKDNAFLTNVTGTMYLLDEAAKYEAFFVFISTDFVFSGEEGMYKEDDERKPVNYYGETKLLAEDEVMKYRHDWSIVRTVLVYGKPVTGRENLLTNTVKALQKGESLKIFSDQVRTPTYVEDLARGIVAVVDKNAKGVYHLSGEDVRTPYQMTVETARHLGLDESLITAVTEKDFNQPAKRPQKTGFDISKAKRELGYQPVSFEEGLKKTFEG